MLLQWFWAASWFGLLGSGMLCVPSAAYNYLYMHSYTYPTTSARSDGLRRLTWISGLFITRQSFMCTLHPGITDASVDVFYFCDMLGAIMIDQ